MVDETFNGRIGDALILRQHGGSMSAESFRPNK